MITIFLKWNLMKFGKWPWVIFIVKAEVVAVVDDPKKDARTLHVDEAESKQILKVSLKWTIIFFCATNLKILRLRKLRTFGYLWLRLVTFPHLSSPFLTFLIHIYNCEMTDWLTNWLTNGHYNLYGCFRSQKWEFLWASQHAELWS